ncbi:MAG TPA: response regulator [Thermoanaerobaculia bacterium]
MKKESDAVLIVEDDPAIRRLVAMVLKRNGYAVDLAADGLEALERIAATDYDAIVLDLMMPRLDGYTLLNRLAKDEPHRLRKVIVTSAASPGTIRNRLEGQPFSLLTKPFDILELQGAVRACIEQNVVATDIV